MLLRLLARKCAQRTPTRCPALARPQACRARGMRAPFGEGAAEFMRQQLGEWIDWSLNKCAAEGRRRW